MGKGAAALDAGIWAVLLLELRVQEEPLGVGLTVLPTKCWPSKHCPLPGGRPCGAWVT